MYYLPFAIELIGTFIFLYVIISSGGNAIAIGVALAAMVFFGGKISGGNFNPAVSFMMYLNNQLTTSKLFVYILAQIIGASLALWLYNNKNQYSA
jgi:aquaporin Z